MARFIAEIQGNRGAASRLGSKDSGIRGHVHGWDRGVQVVAWVDPNTGRDRFRIAIDTGSNGRGLGSMILADVDEDGTVTLDPFGDIARKAAEQ